jgi:hypothetical protein
MKPNHSELPITNLVVEERESMVVHDRVLNGQNNFGRHNYLESLKHSSRLQLVPQTLLPNPFPTPSLVEEFELAHKSQHFEDKHLHEFGLAQGPLQAWLNGAEALAVGEDLICPHWQANQAMVECRLGDVGALVGIGYFLVENCDEGVCDECVESCWEILEELVVVYLQSC